MGEKELKFCIKYSTVFGRYLVADKNLESHELIIDEKPLVLAPSGYFDIDPESQNPLPVCIGCLRSQNAGTSSLNFTKCACCSWPVCGVNCIGIDKFHTEAECMLFQSNGICWSPRSLRMVYLIRCCLMSLYDQENWQKLLQLADSSSVDVVKTDKDKKETINDCQLQQENTGDNLEGLVMNKQDRIDYKFLKEVCQMEHVDEELVMKINGVKKVNGFGFSNCDSDDVRYYGIAIYFVASMASHGCSPNLTTQVSYDPLMGFPMIFRTKKQIDKGQVLQIAYRTHWLVLGTLRRREKIFQDHHFWCFCSRCSDPSENSSAFSAFICPDCQGSILPVNPLCTHSSWKCDMCGHVRDEKIISDILETINNSIENILETQADSMIKFEQLSKILKENSILHVLHPNHYLMMRSEIEWIIHFPFQLLQNSDDAWELFILLVERAQHCKTVYSKIIPDWLEKNYFVDIVIGKSYLLYYLTPDVGSNLSISEDLELDLMKTSLKHIEAGLQYAEPFSEIAMLAKSSCKSLKLRIQKIMTTTVDKFKCKECNECD